MGTKPAKKDIQIRRMDQSLKNGLWNIVDRNYFLPYMNKILSDWEHYELFQGLWDELFKSRLTELRPSRTLINFRIMEVEPKFDLLQWNEVYDVLEYLEQNTDDEILKSKFKLECNKILAREYSAYRFIEEQICEISSKEEINEIEEAINSPLITVNLHLQTALRHLSNRDNPDLRNSIKESISAVETICILIVGKNKASLGQALNYIKNQSNTTISIPDNLIDAFKKLYDYASQDNGIRHSLLEEPPKLTFADARFMLIACSAFVNYLVSKADDANIQFMNNN
jgi:hypothetical protein